MTTLYRPVLIESAEQAEALPEGTIAVMPERDASGPAVIAVKAYDNEWWGTSCCEMTNAQMIGSKALVPVEAEEETRIGTLPWIGTSLALASNATNITRQSRLVTTWEEA